eukprot:4501675-Pyramimonas_sp.AAC.1
MPFPSSCPPPFSLLLLLPLLLVVVLLRLLPRGRERARLVWVLNNIAAGYRRSCWRAVGRRTCASA